MGGVCTHIGKRVCCCQPCNNEKGSTPSNARFKTHGTRMRVMDRRVRERFAVPQGKYNVKLPGEKQVVINSAAFVQTGDVALSDSFNKKLKLFSSKFQIISYLDFPGAVQHVCASVNLPLLYATFPDRVRQICIDGTQMKRSGFIKPPGTCRGVYVNKFEGKAVSICTDENSGKVHLLSPAANLQLELEQDDQGNPLFIKPDQIVVTRNLKIIVIDKGRNCVVGVSPAGQVLFHYKGLRFPTGLVCDEQNNIYISNSNCIHQINDRGGFVKLFITKAEIGISPLSLSYSPGNKLLLVTGRGPKVVLFKMIQ